METVESLKRRIHTAEDLHSLVRTMKALAAVNIRQLEHAVESLADYRRTIEMGLRVVLRHRGRSTVSARTSPQRTLGAIVLGSDQGMCGQLNDQIVAFAQDYIRNTSIPEEGRAVLAVGGRVASRLQDVSEELETTLPVAGSTSGITPLVHDILLRVERWHTESNIDRIVVFFCEHASRATYRPRRLDLLPIDRRWLDTLHQQKWPTRVLPTFTMDADRLFSALVRQYLFVSLYRACAESLASENASRLAAMRGAERSIGDRIGELTRLFHQQRQLSITEELLDIASGFEALSDVSGA
ncbi:MAG: F0F1 ATP synthase subunit gamma [Planctomycetota bacterium]|nr:MAG: F0F1 ATP synthase subunit gamma [Planctomycetota bacterium]REJ89716.1 MAG: F0F1 ATP synthase subunit gamma [Planctomycetota bacterium]REK26650.1 MAG: F0F1 ATP synthase subunit gamma [Planctomycetota bacterium]REK47332.1 MAG: F0F1 ATP synthase subunit gamma [Planctomycetota bacterium]